MTSGENEITFPLFMASTMRYYQLEKGIRRGKWDEDERVMVKEGSPLIYPSKLEGLELTGPKRSFCKEPERDKGVIIPQTWIIPRWQSPGLPQGLWDFWASVRREEEEEEVEEAFLLYM